MKSVKLSPIINAITMTRMQSVDYSVGRQAGLKADWISGRFPPALNQMGSQSDPQIIKRVWGFIVSLITCGDNLQKEFIMG